MKTHFFLAIPVLSQANNSLVDWKEHNIDHFPFQKWVHPQDLHITLVFLGYVEKDVLKQLGDRLEKMSQRYRSFSLKISELNTFGESERPRIFWAGVEKEPLLIDLQKDVVKACIELGIDIDKRSYTPHITLARRWKGLERYSPELAEQSFTKEFKRTWEVNRFHLYQSHMGKSPMYEPVRTFFLNLKEV